MSSLHVPLLWSCLHPCPVIGVFPDGSFSRSCLVCLFEPCRVDCNCAFLSIASYACLPSSLYLAPTKTYCFRQSLAFPFYEYGLFLFNAVWMDNSQNKNLFFLRSRPLPPTTTARRGHELAIASYNHADATFLSATANDYLAYVTLNLSTVSYCEVLLLTKSQLCDITPELRNKVTTVREKGHDSVILCRRCKLKGQNCKIESRRCRICHDYEITIAVAWYYVTRQP